MQIFHIGYPKCGSTTIQDLLKADPAINFLGKPYRNPRAQFLVRELLAFSDLRMLPDRQLDEMRRILCDGSPVISDELLSGIGFAHGIALCSLLQIVDNIALLTGGDYVAHVVLRAPASFIRSYHGQMVRMGGRITFDQFCSLVLLRRHHWVFEALSYRAILRSEACRSGKLRPVLFERLFKDGGLPEFMRDAFGMARLPEDTDMHSNPSETDAVLDYAAPRHPEDPAKWLELQVTEPSVQEYTWIDRMPPEQRQRHMPLWAEHRRRAMMLGQRETDVLNQARKALGHQKEKRPVSPLFRELIAEIAAANAGIAEEFPDLGFDRYGYFEPI